ncbi:MAG: aminoacyl-tRNA hydrolase [Planctomycetaceae bacterium]
MQNTIQHLGTNEFARLRIGIDRPAPGRDVSAYVLQRFSSSEQDAVNRAIEDAANAVELWVKEGPAAAMNRVNGPAS